MAGHSKWANIRFRKGAQDAKRGKLFTKLIREITVAARMGGGDASTNPRLRTAIDKALAGNMTRDTIDRAVKRGAGGDEEGNLSEMRYEGYGVNGVAVMVDCLSDNKNRTVAEVRHAFTKYGGNMGTDGSVAYLFTQQGQINVSSQDEDEVMEAALEAGAEDVISNTDGTVDVITKPEDFLKVKDALTEEGLKITSSDVTMEADLKVSLDKEGAEKLLRLVDTLEDLDDVQNVYTNADISEDILSQL